MMDTARFVHYQTGNAQLDHDDWEIFKHLDDVVVILKAHDYTGALLLMKQLLVEFDQHLGREAELMHIKGYSEQSRAYHEQAHDILRQKLLHATDAIAKGTTSFHLISDIEHKLTEHIDHFDIQMISHISMLHAQALSA